MQVTRDGSMTLTVPNLLKSYEGKLCIVLIMMTDLMIFQLDI